MVVSVCWTLLSAAGAAGAGPASAAGAAGTVEAAAPVAGAPEDGVLPDPLLGSEIAAPAAVPVTAFFESDGLTTSVSVDFVVVFRVCVAEEGFTTFFDDFEVIFCSDVCELCSIGSTAGNVPVVEGGATDGALCVDGAVAGGFAFASGLVCGCC
ncbi:MAG: hypothetical protein ABJC61_09270 [Acidobacteriota bacterium]